MNVQELMTPAPIQVTTQTPLSTCAVLLARHTIRHLPVVDADGRPVGLVSDVDLFAHGTMLEAGWLSREGAPTTAGAVMSTAPTAGPYGPASRLLRYLSTTPRDAVLIKGAGDRLVGIITEHDGLRLAQGVLSEQHPAWRAPTAQRLHTAPAGQPASVALATMIRARIRHLLVVRGGALRGVVSLRDLIEDGVQQPDNAMTIGSVVRRSSAVTITPATSAAQAARTMTRLRIGCLPVLDDDQQLVGVVSRTDLIRQLAETLHSEDQTANP